MTSASETETPPVVPGYAIGTLIAHGAFATVWSARALERDEELAVKIVPVAAGSTGPEEGGQDADSLAFELSALASTRGKGDHFVEVHEVVAIDDPRPAVAIVMERLRFGTLARLVATRGHLTAGEVVTLITPIAHTLGVLHDSAVIHADLSPSNIGFDGLARPVLLDLGVSTVIGTPREHVYGTPGFLAPEVAAGQLPTAGADVYAVGALAWYALTGGPPAIPAERASLAQLLPAVPRGLVAAVERALEPEPEARGSARDLATAVYESARAEPISMVQGEDPARFLTHRLRAIAREAPETEPATRSQRRSTLRRRTRREHVRVLATLVVAVLLGAAGVAVAATSRGPASMLPVSAEDAATGPATTPLSSVLADPPTQQVLEGLLNARARAWTEGQSRSLQEVFTADSPMLASDTAALEQAAAFVYEGLQFSSSDVDVHSESADRIIVVATVSTSPYSVRRAPTGTDGQDPTIEPRPGSRSRLGFTLTREDEGWRISEVEELTGS